jgi:hypothetical protein
MKIIRAVMILCLMATMVCSLRSQEQKKGASQTDNQEHEKRDVVCSEEPHLRCVDICELAEQVLTPTEADKCGLQTAKTASLTKLKIKIQNRQTKKMRTRSIPGHTDITLSIQNHDKVEFFCSKRRTFRIDRFEKAQVGASTINPAAPDSPFASPTFPTGTLDHLLLGPPMATVLNPPQFPEQYYKFSFTAFMNPAHPEGCPVDPHLIVKP